MVIAPLVIFDDLAQLLMRNANRPADPFRFELAIGNHPAQGLFTQIKHVRHFRQAKVLLTARAAPLLQSIALENVVRL